MSTGLYHKTHRHMSRAQINAYWKWRATLRGVADNYFKFQVEGAEQLTDCPAVVAARHPSWLDGPLISLAYPWLLRSLSKLELFDGSLIDHCITYAGAIAIDRKNGGPGLAYAQRVLEEGTSVLIFPEGKLSTGMRMRPLQKGPILLAIKANCPVVPATTIGTEAAWPIGQKFPQPSPIKVAFGAPYWIPYDGDPADVPQEVIDCEIARLTVAVDALLPEAYWPTETTSSLPRV